LFFFERAELGHSSEVLKHHGLSQGENTNASNRKLDSESGD
jgi:hypothetical protein